MKYLAKFTLVLGVFMAGLFVLGSTAHAATFTVTSTGDDSAVDPAVSCATVLPDCTLRSSIEAAEAQAGADIIEFNIPGGGVHTFTPASDYPSITSQLTIDGSTQPGASCGTLVPTTLPAANSPHNLLIEVNLTNAPSGIDVNGSSDGVTIRGLVINNGAASFQSSPTNVLVECNYIGTNADGTSAVSFAGVNMFLDVGQITIQNNLLSGSQFSAIGGFGFGTDSVIQNNLIGMNATGEAALGNSQYGIDAPSTTTNLLVNHNVIAGNSLGGVRAQSGNGHMFTGNYVGLNVLGAPVANGGAGITLYGSNNFTVGGTAASQRNIISANTGDGLHIYSDCNVSFSINSTIYNNYIGTNTSGEVQSGYGNGAAGIEVNEYYGGCVSVYNHKIGGDEAGQPNIIAGNTGQGLLIHQSAAQDVFSITAIANSIYANGQFGIDLAADSDSNSGVADTDLGPNPINSIAMMYPSGGYANYYLNHPTLNSVNYSGNQVTVNYTFQAPSVTENLPFISAADVVGYRLDFYLNDGGQDGAYIGNAQGKTHLGSFIVDSSESGANHTFTSPVTLTGTQNVTATATVLWTTSPSGGREGTGPPYQNPK